MLTSKGIVSPGRTNTVSPTRTSSVGTSVQIASEQRTVSIGLLLSDEEITSRDWVDMSDYKINKITQVITYTLYYKSLLAMV